MTAFLGVERSLSGKRWEERTADERLVQTLAQRYGLPDVAARAMATRGIDVDGADAFLKPALRESLPDPSHLKDMDCAVERLADAITSGEPIGIFGDYDVDGATSSALITRFVRAVGGTARTYIPDRLKEGYGPNIDGLRSLKDQGAAVVITVDCGITAFEPLEAAGRAGVEVIVVDHHVAEPRLPDALAVVNPNRLDDDSAHGQLAAVGVAFLLVIGLNRALRDRGHYRNRAEPDLLSWLDLVALGTVCDVVPLRGLNRALVAQGLKVMARRGNHGIAALCDVARLKEAPAAYHVGFVLGPRVNAGGRVGEAGMGARLLSTDDPTEAAHLAEQLDRYNEERRAMERSCLDEAVQQADAGGTDDALVYVSSPDWHPGIIGIVAGRLKERYNRPACVVAYENGVGKGSGRSVSGLDLGAAVIAARQSGLLDGGGGHQMAAGFTVSREKESEFRRFLAGRLADQVGDGGLMPRLMLDGAVSPQGLSVALAAQMETLGPFGSGNSEPRFVVPEAKIVEAKIVGTHHVSCAIGREDGRRVKAIAFRAADEPMGRALLAAKGGVPIHLAGKLKIDRWQGREAPQFIIEDAAGGG